MTTTTETETRETCISTAVLFEALLASSGSPVDRVFATCSYGQWGPHLQANVYLDTKIETPAGPLTMTRIARVTGVVNAAGRLERPAAWGSDYALTDSRGKPVRLVKQGAELDDFEQRRELSRLAEQLRINRLGPSEYVTWEAVQLGPSEHVTWERVQQAVQQAIRAER